MFPAGRVARASQGSMLIELIIVMAIVGILVAIAIPSYQEMRLRTRVAEGLAIVGPYELEIVELVNRTGYLPDGPDDPADVDYFNATGAVVVRRVRWSRLRSALEVWYGAGAGTELNGKILWLKPRVLASGSVTWRCMNHTEAQYAIASGYLPSSCR